MRPKHRSTEVPASCPGHPRRFVVGVGARPRATAEDLGALIDAVLADHAIAPDTVLALATLDRRAGHPAVRTVAAAHGWPVLGYPADDLAAVTAAGATVPAVSARVQAAVGTPSVAEAAALRAAGADLPDVAGASVPGVAQDGTSSVAGVSVPSAAYDGTPSVAGASAPRAPQDGTPGIAGTAAPHAPGAGTPGAAGTVAPHAAGPGAPGVAGAGAVCAVGVPDLVVAKRTVPTASVAVAVRACGPGEEREQ
ncbi:hypothetical protein JCM9533A_23340 [Catenuloplanes niger JCM 9533]